MELDNDNIRNILDHLDIKEIIQYCDSSNTNIQLCNTKSFKSYFISRFYQTMDKDLYNLDSKTILLKAYVNIKGVNVLFEKETDKIKELLIEKYLGNYPTLLGLSNKELLTLIDILYPREDGLDNYRLLEGKDWEIIPGLLKTSFRLRYSPEKIRLIYDKITTIDNPSFTKEKYLKLLCIYFDRKDVYKEIFGVQPSVGYTNVRDPFIYPYIISNYLTYSNDNVNDEVEIYPELLEYSDNPLYLFEKYRDKFLEDDSFREGYNGILTNNTSNSIGYKISGREVDDGVCPLDLKIGGERNLLLSYPDTLYNISKSQGIHPYYINKCLDVLVKDKELYKKCIEGVNVEYLYDEGSLDIGLNYYQVLLFKLHGVKNGMDEELMAIKDIIKNTYS